jgi:diguanylate cyclase (GGDEF)-like protein/PAS domain S-box-containing protein
MYDPAVDDGEGGSIFSPGGSFEDYPGAVLLVGHNGIVLAANALGEPIGAMLRGEGHGELHSAIRAALAGNTTQVNPLLLKSDGKFGVARSFDVVVLPWAHGAAALLLGRDVTLERSLRLALVESRQRYKDLVDLAADFAWECDCEGRFTYLSREVVLGYMADDLLGREARSVVLKGRSSGPSPFAVEDKRMDTEVWLSAADGRSVCLAVTSVPLFDEEGRRQGARGICRDITTVRQHQTEMADARHREKLLAYVLQMVRDQLDPGAMLTGATDALLLAVGASGVAFYRLDSEEGFDVQARAGEELPAEAERALLTSISSSDEIELDRQGIKMLARLTKLQEKDNGLLALWRRGDGEPWREEERQLIAEAAREIAIAQERLTREQRLERLSEADSLTGLLNRRSFEAHLGSRLEHCGAETSGALLYLDVDAFKRVNDEAGHAKGDALLVTLAEVLRGQVRSDDLAGRLGGDEFAVYLGNIEPDSAEAKAKKILAAWRRSLSDDKGWLRDVGLSIGIACINGRTNESGQAVIDRADKAMYRAKRAGKGGYVVSGAAYGQDNGRS